MTIVPCAICSGELPPQKAGAKRLACPGACTKARNKELMRVNRLKRLSTAEGRAALAVSAARANRKWREKNAESNRVRVEEWRNANRDRMAESNREYRQNNPDKVREKNLRRRARLLGAFVETVDLVELFERDNGVCGICVEPVDPALAWPDKMSKTLDHIQPLSRGGAHSWANSQLAHAVCNSRKNDRVSV